MTPFFDWFYEFLVFSIGKDYNSDYIVFDLDTQDKSFRNDVCQKYKTNRSEELIEWKQQLPITIQWIETMGFNVLSKLGFIFLNKGDKMLIFSYFIISGKIELEK